MYKMCRRVLAHGAVGHRGTHVWSVPSWLRHAAEPPWDSTTLIARGKLRVKAVLLGALA